ncbi:unnamed protein product [Meloidogyne enterolobii]|uniref:Uncharacterized protein n=1 Tax=Meloidogyne enterolobii TaxID=390850 RepID=A0ACB1A8G4_MELEN
MPIPFGFSHYTLFLCLTPDTADCPLPFDFLPRDSRPALFLLVLSDPSSPRRCCKGTCLQGITSPDGDWGLTTDICNTA